MAGCLLSALWPQPAERKAGRQVSAVSFCLSRPSPKGSLWFPSFLCPARDALFFYLENLTVLEFRIVAKAEDTTTGTGKKVL